MQHTLQFFKIQYYPLNLNSWACVAHLRPISLNFCQAITHSIWAQWGSTVFVICSYPSFDNLAFVIGYIRNGEHFMEKIDEIRAQVSILSLLLSLKTIVTKNYLFSIYLAICLKLSIYLTICLKLSVTRVLQRSWHCWNVHYSLADWPAVVLAPVTIDGMWNDAVKVLWTKGDSWSFCLLHLIARMILVAKLQIVACFWPNLKIRLLQKLLAWFWSIFVSHKANFIKLLTPINH